MIYPYFIRTQPIETIANTYDYNKGVINNGDSVGNITFAVPYDAPNTLYYTSQTNNTLSGRFNIINNSKLVFSFLRKKFKTVMYIKIDLLTLKILKFKAKIIKSTIQQKYL